MKTQRIEITQATVRELERLVPLFEAYRQFYRYPSDLKGARQFLLERFRHNQSVIFIAFEGDEAVGFMQLYPSFSSGALAQIFVLNDLFVAPEARGRGIGSALLRTAAEYGRALGALRLVLATEITNTTAQSVYEKMGWKRDTTFFRYTMAI